MREGGLLQGGGEGELILRGPAVLYEDTLDAIRDGEDLLQVSQAIGDEDLVIVLVVEPGLGVLEALPGVLDHGAEGLLSFGGVIAELEVFLRQCGDVIGLTPGIDRIARGGVLIQGGEHADLDLVHGDVEDGSPEV